MTYIDRYLTEVIEIAQRIDRQEIQQFADAVNEVRENKGRIFFAGVGGSAGNCSHAVNDFRKIVGVESYAITDNVSELTARINDEGWGTCFSKWLEGSRLNEKDALIVFSVGGGSPGTSANIVHAIDLAVTQGATVLSIVSREGGHAKEHSNVCILVPVVSQTRVTPHAEEWQAILWHLIVNMLPWRYDGD